jgi:hypothetical protein
LFLASTSKESPASTATLKVSSRASMPALNHGLPEET